MIGVMRSEIVKLVTVPTPFLLLGTQAALIVAGVSGASRHGGIGLEATLAHGGFTSLFSLILGITAIAGEHRHRTIIETYLGAPDRTRVFAAKLVAYMGAGVAFGTVSAAVAATTTAIWFTAMGEGFSWSDPGLWRLLVGIILSNTLFAVLGVGLGALVTNLTAAVVAALAWIASVELILANFLGRAGDWLPLAAGQALAGFPGTSLSQFTAGMTLLGYAILMAVAALAVTLRRDVA